MNETTGKIIGTINAMQTLIENFPMWLFSWSNAERMSPIDFVVKVLHQLGVNDYLLIDEIIKMLFNSPYAVEKLSSGLSAITFDEQSEFLVGVENEVKTIILNMLSMILSCSIIPEIPEEYLDNNPDGMKSIPIASIDTSNLLTICPTTEIGKNFYKVSEDMTPNTLYKSEDLNAVLWYVINRGTTINETELNKMMWDSRLVGKDYDEFNRDSAEKWNFWLNSTKDNGIFSTSGKTELYKAAFESGMTIEKTPLHPIMQFYPSEFIGNNNFINYTISSQSFNGKTIYDFNREYLENIRIFNPRSIIANMINTLLNNNILNGLNIQPSLQDKILDEQINILIARAIETDDENISDCFFTFSNDELNAMMDEMERQRYYGKYLNSETSPSIEIQEGYGLDLLNQINSTATINEKLTTLTRSVYEISSLPEEDEAIKISDKNAVGYNTKWFNDVIMSIIKPMARCLLSPKVMLLFVINFDMMGLVYLEDIKSIDDIMKIFYRKMFAAIFSLIKYLKDKIARFLLDLFLNKIQPLLEKYTEELISEKLKYWTDLLAEAALCVMPLSNKELGQIDNVRYADITQEQITPESTNSC